MDACDTLRKMLDMSGMSKYGLSKALGKSPTYIANLLRNDGDIGVENLARMAEIMGCKIKLEADSETFEIAREV